MNALNVLVIGTVPLLVSGTVSAQNGNMMGGSSWGGWMGGYGGMWMPILLVVAVVAIVVLVMRRK